MIPLATGTMIKATMAVTTSAALLTGTPAVATAAPAMSPTVTTTGTTTAAAQNLTDWGRFDPRRRGFRVHFRTWAQCAYFANHDRRPRTNGWDCRHGWDRNFPWEYWY